MTLDFQVITKSVFIPCVLDAIVVAFSPSKPILVL